MFFSIVVPVYNVEKYLRQCVDSIVRQNFSDFELILVDDGSKDSSPAICDEYAAKDNRIKVVHKNNGGQAQARNIGTDKAKGNYIIYIDSDDYIAEDSFLGDIYKKAEKNADIICYKFCKYYEDTSEMKSCRFRMPVFYETDSMAQRIEKLVVQDAFYCSPWTKAIKRTVLTNNQVRFQNGLLSEDQEWYYNVLINAESIEGINKSYIVYRQRTNSTSTSWKMQNLTDTIKIIEKWKEKIEKGDWPPDYKNSLMNSVSKLYCNLLIGYTRYSNSEKSKYYKDLKRLASLLQYHKNPRVKIFYRIYRIGGFRLLMTGLKVICKVQ